jgi:hypothetical protein
MRTSGATFEISYEDNEIDIPTADGKSCLGECVGSTILWHKRDILLVGQVPLAAPDYISPAPQQQEQEAAPEHSLPALPSPQP